MGNPPHPGLEPKDSPGERLERQRGAGQLLTSKTRLTDKMIEKAVQDAVKIVAAAQAATPKPKPSQPSVHTSRSYVTP